MSEAKLQVILESGKSRTFASVLHWPGWVRSGRGDEAALETLLAYGPRYERAMQASGLRFTAPKGIDAFEVIERLKGNATTDFGVPEFTAAAESEPIDAAALEHLLAVLAACWAEFGRVAAGAMGKELRKGPRGGGRSVDKMIEHVIEPHYGYMKRILWREGHDSTLDLAAAIDAINDADTRALTYAASAEMPAKGPRGGTVWQPRYFVRRAAWHILDHTWEIEDKLEA